VGERSTPLSECLPGLALIVRSALPTLFENFVSVEGKPLCQEADGLRPRLLGINKVPVGNGGKGPGVPHGQRAAEAITGSLA